MHLNIVKIPEIEAADIFIILLLVFFLNVEHITRGTTTQE